MNELELLSKARQCVNALDLFLCTKDYEAAVSEVKQVFQVLRALKSGEIKTAIMERVDNTLAV